MRDSVSSANYSRVCNVLRQWSISLISTYRVYRLYDTISECLVLCCKAAVFKEGVKKIKPQDMLEDIPDEIIDIDLSGLEDILTLEAWEQLKDTGKNLVAIVIMHDVLMCSKLYSGEKETAVEVRCLHYNQVQRYGDVRRLSILVSSVAK